MQHAPTRCESARVSQEMVATQQTHGSVREHVAWVGMAHIACSVLYCMVCLSHRCVVHAHTAVREQCI
jgi:hypothetical protein